MIKNNVSIEFKIHPKMVNLSREIVYLNNKNKW